MRLYNKTVKLQDGRPRKIGSAFVGPITISDGKI